MSRVIRVVEAWARYYTRELSPTVALDRRAELASDLFEHAAAAGTPAAILSRAIRGIPADLAWRHEERRALRRRVPMERRVVGGLIGWMVGIAASSLLAFGVFSIAVTTQFVVRGEVRPFSATAVTVLCLTIAVGCGVIMLARRRTRALGALWLAPTSLLIHFGLFDLFNKSQTIARLSSEFLGWGIVSVLIMAAVSLVFLSAAVLWMPTRKDAS